MQKSTFNFYHLYRVNSKNVGQCHHLHWWLLLHELIHCYKLKKPLLWCTNHRLQPLVDEIMAELADVVQRVHKVQCHGQTLDPMFRQKAPWANRALCSKAAQLLSMDFFFQHVTASCCAQRFYIQIQQHRLGLHVTSGRPWAESWCARERAYWAQRYNFKIVVTWLYTATSKCIFRCHVGCLLKFGSQAA